MHEPDSAKICNESLSWPTFALSSAKQCLDTLLSKRPILFLNKSGGASCEKSELLINNALTMGHLGRV